MMASAGFLEVFFVIVFFSGKFIRPIAESYEKQKHFITDSGHEIKTPLTIISANTDLPEMDIGENESLDEFRRQVRHLVLSVRNPTDPEIRPDQLPHVFDRLYRSDHSRNSQTGGHGIGLSIAKANATAHGGKITVQTMDRHLFVISAMLLAS